MSVELTDETDPFLLYSFDMNRDEFSKFKIEQNLLVEFASFPAELVRLFDACATPQREGFLLEVVSKQTPKPEPSLDANATQLRQQPTEESKIAWSGGFTRQDGLERGPDGYSSAAAPSQAYRSNYPYSRPPPESAVQERFTTQSYLNIVEVNQFKRLVHLSLPLVEGNDRSVKLFLGRKVEYLKVRMDAPWFVSAIVTHCNAGAAGPNNVGGRPFDHEK